MSTLTLSVVIPPGPCMLRPCWWRANPIFDDVSPYEVSVRPSNPPVPVMKSATIPRNSSSIGVSDVPPDSNPNHVSGSMGLLLKLSTSVSAPEMLGAPISAMARQHTRPRWSAFTASPFLIRGQCSHATSKGPHYGSGGGGARLYVIVRIGRLPPSILSGQDPALQSRSVAGLDTVGSLRDGLEEAGASLEDQSCQAHATGRA